MKRALLLITLFLLPLSTAAAGESGGRALVLYDSSSTQFNRLGLMYSIMLRNLLGHFDMGADLLPVESYTAGRLETYSAIFYMGQTYNNPILEAFLTDVHKTAKPVVWFKYNLWQYSEDPAYQFQQRYGFNFTGLRGLNAAPSSSNPDPGFFETVLYKGKSLVKYYQRDPITGIVNADPDFGMTAVLDAAKATVIAPAKNSKTGEQAPYIVRSGSFWYVADVPFSFIGPRDRYLVFCDILHDILGVKHDSLKRAMVRLEDVGADVSPAAMKKLVDFLHGKNIPFSIATIPFYRDPLGHYNNGAPLEVHFAQAESLQTALEYATARGGSVLMHGYTHQYESTPNRYSAVSADDFEFWDASNNMPVAEDSTAWTGGRISAGLTELGSAYPPFAWEVPHYQASPVAYRLFPKYFRDTYQRAVYYTSDVPSLNNGLDYASGMFYPYIISSDYYGQRVIPENLGNIEYDISDVDPNSNTQYPGSELLINAQYALVVRDGFASFFFHPFWVEPDFAHLNAYADFTNLVNGITALGYKWVAAKDLVGKADPASFILTTATAEQTISPGQSATYILNVASTNGAFTAPVSFACTGLPAAASCSFSPQQVVPGTSGAAVTLAIHTTTHIASLENAPLIYGPASYLIAGLFPLCLASLVPRSKKSVTMFIILLLSLALASCGGGGQSVDAANPPQSPSQPVQPPQTTTYTVTIEGTAGIVTTTTSVKLVVKK